MSKFFSLGREGSAEDGSFQRQASTFRDTDVEPEAGRYHLYVSWACPWAHRTVIGRRLKGLEDAISLSAVDPYRDETGWAFTGGEFTDPVNGFGRLGEAYEASDPDYDGRFSVPVLWDKLQARIVNNESGDILRLLDTAFQPLATTDVVLVSEPLRDDIDELNERLYDRVNNAVYKAGFSTRQEVYEHEVVTLFDTLDELDERLGTRRFLFGDAPVETDWRLFTTLVRFDAVYAIHFKCSLQRITEYEHLWPYLRDLYQWPGIAETVRFDQIRTHYYGTHPMINPNGILALQPRGDFLAPHGREAMAL
ncbi:MAG: glutathionyl-hydroquinone reductase [Solirubrobacteraceae bacterium]|nr:glutathionyl-hydroquinone reductase [Solirubrobacteraceae bacterium]